MKGLKFTALCFGIGLALLVQLMSTRSVHADGVKTPLAGFTPHAIGTPRSAGAPTRIHFAENTPAAKESSTPGGSLSTPLPTRIDVSASTATKSAVPTVAPLSTRIVSLTKQLSWSTTPVLEATGTVTAGSLNATPTRIALSPRSTLAATLVAGHEQSKPSKPGQATMSVEAGVDTSSPHPIENATNGGAQEPTLGDVLQELPENTGIIVLDQGEKPLPLVSQEAAQAISQSDPVWCPGDSSQAPTPGANGCTISYSTVAELVANAGASIAANGTIWISNGQQLLETGPITIDGSMYTNWANYSLTLQGGWNGTSIGANSVFNVPIYIINWNANVTINHITIDGASGSGLGITTNGGDVAINESRFRNNRAGSTIFPWGDGADISPNGGNVTITNSSFNNNNWDGLFVVNSNTITITNSRFNSNGLNNGTGGGLNAFLVNTIDIHNSEFTGNLSYDVSAYCNSGGSLVASYPDVVPPFAPPVLLDIFVDQNCSSSAYLAQPTATPSPTSTATLMGPTLTATATPTGRLLPTSTTTPSSTAPVVVIQPWTPSRTPRGQPTSTRTPNRAATIHPGGIVSGGSALRAKSKGEFFLDCKLQASFTYPLPNGDKVEIICPSGYWSGKASISRLDNTTLPDKLPVGFTYASAFLVNITKLSEPARMVDGEYLRDEVKVIPEGGYIKASFRALGQETYSILYWDVLNSRWIPLKDFMLDENGDPQVFDLYPEDPDNLLKIVSGVQQVTNPLDPRVEVSTNFPGIFVLAQH